MTAEFRPGIPAFVQVYDRLRELIARDGLQPGERLPNEVVLAGELGVTRELVRESLLLLEEDGHVVRDRARHWRVATPAGERIGIAEGFHRQLGGAVPVRRLHAAVEGGSSWSHELLRTEERTLVWETVFAVDGRLLASTLELMPESALPEDVLGATDAEQRDVERWPTLLDALGPARRAAMAPEVWRVSAVSTGTERLSWMELPLHGIPAAITLVMSEAGVPTYLAKNLFDLGSLILTIG